MTSTRACSFDVVDAATSEVFGPLLKNLTQRRFFRYFKVALDRPCKYWPDDGQCARESCAVRVCTDDEAPSKWVEEDRNRSAWKQKPEPEPGFLCSSELQVVDRQEDSDKWAESGGDEVWIDQGSDDQMNYVDLLRNPEGYTGYDGEQAASHLALDLRGELLRPGEDAAQRQLLLAWRSEEPKHSGQCLERQGSFLAHQRPAAIFYTYGLALHLLGGRDECAGVATSKVAGLYWRYSSALRGR